MWKKLAWSFSAVLLSCLFLYTAIYLNTRNVRYYDDDGTWIVFSYQKLFIRQYALDEDARDLYRRTLKTGTRTFLGEYTGDIGDDWFCVYIDPEKKYYRLFRLAEEIELLRYRFISPD